MPNTRYIAIQMDPLGSLKPRTDSTIVLALEAQARGYSIFCFTPNKLSFHNGEIVARGQEVTFFDRETDHYTAGDEETRDLSSASAALIRQDPPFDMAYITTTYLLERLNESVPVVNNPAAIRDCPEKWLVTSFAEFIPPTLISADAEQLIAFRKEYKDIVLKPLYGFGGNSVFHVKGDDPNFGSLLETFPLISPEPWIVQRFIPEVRQGDLRVMLVDGKMEGAIRRTPQAGEIRANMRVGGRASAVELSPRQQMICDAVGPELARRGIVLAGLDLIGDYLVEINITSPTGLRAIRATSGNQPEKPFWDAVEARMS